MKRIVIVGAGDLGKQIYHYIKDITNMNVIGFLDDFESKGNRVVEEVSVIGKISDIKNIQVKYGFDEIVIGVGYKHLEFRRTLFESLKESGFTFAKIIHPTVYLDKTAVIEEGVVLFPNCHVDKGAKICCNSVLNIGCSIAHDSEIGPHSFLGPKVNIAGFVVTEGLNFLGIGTIIVNNVRVASGVQTGGGALVIKSIDTAGLYVGTPVRKIEK